MSFIYTASAADWGRIAPELVLTIVALLVLMVDLLLPQPVKNQKSSTTFLILPLLSLLGLAGAIIATIILFIFGDHLPAFNMMILAAATSFLTIFLGLEMLSLALYILSGFVLRRSISQESGMKYFLLSSFASAFLLYGIVMIYGATGNTSFIGVHTFLFTHFPTTRSINPTIVGQLPTFLLIGMGLLIVGFAFKVSAIPFQAWTPDVYEGAPAPVTAFMSVGTKAAAMIAFARVFDVMLPLVRPDWEVVVLAITILTIIGGNIMALVQSNVKRMLAYSSIANAGYLLIGVVA